MEKRIITISREFGSGGSQGAYDMLKRASHSLESYEQRLHLLARYDAVRDKIDEVERLLDREEPQTLERAKQLLHEIEL